ncbi:aspartate carbamoyltransferase catalytic subunit [Virgibacillus sp. W0430]|uniref:aspartate carbamoyltransferase catalytic subunit n=1 Tax=Virgibacillus sp. W0430 TaxID=3391580 RepID=UPI003F464946
MKHFISVNDLQTTDVLDILDLAEHYRKYDHLKTQKQLFAANLFFEPSTRTKMSFIVAQRKLGIESLDFHSETSSMKKGESLYDTAKTFEAIGSDILVIRHEFDDWPEEICSSLNIPVINAGAGKKEHPTQCMLDLHTIYQEFGHFNKLNIVIAGDIKHSRVARSNAQTLRRMGANVYFCAAPTFMDKTLDFPYISMDEAVGICDVMMLLRIQHERHDQFASVENYHQAFGLTLDREKRMKKSAIILHPAPINRGVEIASELIECERSRIFQQMSNGVLIRMAIITKLLKERGLNDENFIEKRKTVVAAR